MHVYVKLNDDNVIGNYKSAYKVVFCEIFKRLCPDVKTLLSYAVFTLHICFKNVASMLGVLRVPICMINSDLTCV